MQQAGGAAVVHNQKNKVRGLTADLQADAAAFQRKQRGSAPRTRKFLARAAYHRATAITSAHYEGGLEHRRHDHHATRLVEQVLWDVVPHIEDLLHYLPGILKTILFVFCVAGTFRIPPASEHLLKEQARYYRERIFRILHLCASSRASSYFLALIFCERGGSRRVPDSRKLEGNFRAKRKLNSLTHLDFN